MFEKLKNRCQWNFPKQKAANSKPRYDTGFETRSRLNSIEKKLRRTSYDIQTFYDFLQHRRAKIFLPITYYAILAFVSVTIVKFFCITCALLISALFTLLSVSTEPEVGASTSFSKASGPGYRCCPCKDRSQREQLCLHAISIHAILTFEISEPFATFLLSTCLAMSVLYIQLVQFVPLSQSFSFTRTPKSLQSSPFT